jgi:putative PEP-CTERM system TPR-repeat lipoprotein
MVSPSKTRRPLHQRLVALAFASSLVLLTTSGCGEEQLSADAYLEKAEEYRSNGNLQASIIEAKNAIQQDPRNEVARYLLGLNYFDIGSMAAAEKELLQAIKEKGALEFAIIPILSRTKIWLGKHEEVLDLARPQLKVQNNLNSEIMVVRGRAFAGIGDLANARKSFEAARKFQTESHGAYIGLAGLSLSEGNEGQAETMLERAIKIAPKATDVLLFAGQFAYSKGKFTAAEKAYQDLVGNNPERPDFKLNLAGAKIATKKIVGAITILDKILRKRPNLPRANYLRAVAAFESKDYAGASEYANQVLKVFPNHLSSVRLLGAASFAEKKYEQASQNLERYIENVAEPDRTVQVLFAASRFRLGEKKEALALLESFAKTQKNDAEILSLIGRTAAQTGDIYKSSTYFSRVVELRPNDAAGRAALGAAQIALGKSDRGEKELRKALEIAPDLIAARKALVLGLMRDGQFKKALKEARQWEKDRPKDVAPYVLEGMVLVRLGNRKAARSAFIKATEIDPIAIDALHNLGLLAAVSGNLTDSRKYFERVRTLQPDYLPSLIQLAYIENKMGDRQKAISLMKLARDKDSSALSPAIYLGRHYLMSGKYQLAVDAGRPALRRNPNSAALLEITGRAEIKLKTFKDAELTFAKLVEIKPKSAQAHYYLSLALEKNGDLTRSLQAVERAINQNTNFLDAQLQRTNLLIRQRSYKKAQNAIEALEKNFPSNPLAAELEGDLRLAEKNPKAAAAAYARAVSDKGVSNRQIIKLANAYNLVGNIDKGIQALEGWLSSHPKDQNARFFLAVTLYTNNQLEASRLQFKQLLEKTPKNPVYQNEIATILLQLGKPEEALAHAQKALELAPNHPNILDTMGTVLLELGNAKNALIHLRRAAKHRPDNKTIAVNLARALVETGERAAAKDILEKTLEGNSRFTSRATAKKLLESLK